MPKEAPRASQASTRTPHKKEAVNREARAKSQKMHTCDECGYTTLRADAMELHVRTHTGEKPFACPECPHRSTQQGAMNSHLKVCACYICGCSGSNELHSTGKTPFLCFFPAEHRRFLLLIPPRHTTCNTTYRRYTTSRNHFHVNTARTDSIQQLPVRSTAHVCMLSMCAIIATFDHR